MTTETKTEPKQRSYFSQETVNRYVLDDGVSFIEHKKLDEGLFQAYQDITSKVKLDRTGEFTEVDMKLGEQRRFLIENLCTGWNLVDNDGKPVKFSAAKVLGLPPHIVRGLANDIYEKNEILAGDLEDEDSKK